MHMRYLYLDRAAADGESQSALKCCQCGVAEGTAMLEACGTLFSRACRYMLWSFDGAMSYSMV